jgi:hypothetical protein
MMNKSENRMKSKINLVILLALVLVSAKPISERMAKLTIVNKSGMAIELRLTGSDTGSFYYLRLPKGDRIVPEEDVFWIVPDQYSSSLYYVQLWDPVYGYSCSSKSQSLDLRRNIRLMVFECDHRIAAPGEIPIIKYGASSGRRGR